MMMAESEQGWQENGERTHGEDIGVAHDSVGQHERKHDLEPQRRNVPVYCDLLECI